MPSRRVLLAACAALAFALTSAGDPPKPPTPEPAPVVEAPRNTVVAPWQPSLTVDTNRWPPGDYLLRLDAADGPQQFVPLTVANDR